MGNVMSTSNSLYLSNETVPYVSSFKYLGTVYLILSQHILMSLLSYANFMLQAIAH